MTNAESTYEVALIVEQGDVDCVLLESDDRYVAAWTKPIEGQRQVFAVQVRPRYENRDPEGRQRVEIGWLVPATADLLAHLPAEPSPLAAADIRQLPFSLLRRERERDVANIELHALSAATTDEADSVEHYLGLTGAQLEHLVDAFEVADAVERGSRSPSQVIAERRAISPRTAQGRIARAEAMGFLTPVARGRANRRLTPHAEELRQRLVRRYFQEGGKGNG